MNPATIPTLDLNSLVPVLFPAIGALVVLVADILLSSRKSLLGRPVTKAWLGSLLGMAAGFFLLLSILTAAQSFMTDASIVFDPASPMFRLDRFSNFAIGTVGLGSLLACLLSVHYLVELRISHGEYYALLLSASAGMMVMVGAVDLMLVFVGLELMSIPIYVLAGFDRRNLRSNESALKYFLVGSFASAVLLYGMALLYGATGRTDYAQLRAAFDASNPIALAGLALFVTGFAFKVSSVPFHQWTPDVYEGAPTSVTAYMSVTVKAAAFIALLRFVTEALDPSVLIATDLGGLFAVMAALTILVGNVMAVIQNNVKRMLAWSSIAHGGYVLVGFATATPDSIAAVMFYLFVYVFMNIGAFAVVVALANQGRDADRFDDYAGLARSRPGLAALMTLFMISLAGIPGTAGFIGKFSLFGAAVQGGHVPLTIIAVLGSLISVYFYLRLPVMMYMREPTGDTPPRVSTDTLEGFVLVLCAFAVVFLGLFPNALPGPLSGLRVLEWARMSVAGLM